MTVEAVSRASEALHGAVEAWAEIPRLAGIPYADRVITNVRRARCYAVVWCNVQLHVTGLLPRVAGEGTRKSAGR